MRIELDEKEYNKIQIDAETRGYKRGYQDAGTFVLCEKGKGSDFHVVCKSSLPYCPTCEALKKQPNAFLEKQNEIREALQKIVDKYLPKHKSGKVFSKLVLALEKITS